MMPWIGGLLPLVLVVSAAPRKDPLPLGTWAGNQLPFPFVSAVALAPDDDLALYAAARDDSQGAIFKSVDAGIAWSKISDAPAGDFVETLQVDPFNPARLFALTSYQGPTGPPVSLLYRSLDFATTWSFLTTFAQSLGGDSSLAFDATRPDTVYLAPSYDAGLLRSDDGGESWRELPTPFAGKVRLEGETTGDLLAVATNGVFRSASRGTSWDELTAPPPVCPFITVFAIDPRDPNHFFAGTGEVTIGPFGFVVICGGVFQSTDGGATWTDTGATRGHVTDLKMDRSDPSFLYVAESQPFLYEFPTSIGRILGSRDGGQTWMPLGQFGANRLFLGAEGRRLYAALGGGVVARVIRKPLPVAPR